MAGYVDEFENLKKHDDEVARLVRRLLAIVDPILRRLIADDQTYTKAKVELRRAYNKALASTDFVKELEKSTVRTIVNSSYVESTVKMTKKSYTSRLLKQALIPGDSLIMSKRIRTNTRGIINTQQRILFEGLKSGKTVVQLTREVKNAKIFEEALPKYLDDLAKLRVDGQKALSPAQLQSAKRQISKIKNKGLKRDYDRIIKKLETTQTFENLVANAMDSKTRSLSYRVTQNQTHATIARFKNDTAMKDPDTKLVRTKVYGEYTCPYCLGIASLGWVPVENAALPPHHPHCDCQAKYRKTVRNVEPWKDGEYEKRAAEAIEEQNEKAAGKGRPKSYVPVQKAQDLRKNSLTEQLQNTPE